MRTVKRLQIIASIVGVIWAISLFAVPSLFLVMDNGIIDMKQGNLLFHIVEIPLAFGWIITFVLMGIAGEIEIDLIRKNQI